MATIPTARGHLPKGTSRDKAIAHNRLAKSLEMAVTLYSQFGDDANPALIDRLTDDDFARAARIAGVKEPHSDATRALVRLLLGLFVTLGRLEPTALETQLSGDKALHALLVGTLSREHLEHPSQLTTEPGRVSLVIPL